MRLKKHITYLLLSIFIYFPVFAQNVTFNHLTTDTGLSQNTINSIYIDESGFVWIGTREGLNCYIGKEIRTFKYRKDDPNSLLNNNVLRVTGNKKGKLYLLCTEGISEYDFSQNKFTTLLLGNINCIHYNEKLYIGKRNEIYVLNEETGNFDLYYQLAGRDVVITALHTDTNGQLWIGTNNSGVYNLTERKNIKHLISKGNITAFYQDSSQDIWIGTWEDGIYLINRQGDINNIKHDPLDPASISSNFVRSICEDNQGHFWLGTFNGLNHYQKNIGLIHNYIRQISTPESLSHSSIWSIVKDNQGTIWVGTNFGGVNYFNPEYEIYKRYGASEIEAEGLRSPVVGRIIEDNDGNLWICTEGGGINVFDRRNKKFKWLPNNEGENTIIENHVKAIHYDSQNDIMWIGTHRGGLNKRELKTNKIFRYKMKEGDETTLPSDNITDIEPYKDKLLIATPNGICIFNPATGLCEQLLQNKREGREIKSVADLMVDMDGLLWIATQGQGIYTYNFETDKLVNFRRQPKRPGSLSSNNVNSITQDRAGNVWISTSGGGLDRYKKDTNDFENYDSQRSGFSSDCIYGLREFDRIDGEFLVISNLGFSIFNYPNNSFRNFNKDNGFPLTAINENSLYLTSDGEIFMGGIDGMVSFYVKNLNFTPKPYKMIFSRLTVNGKEINAGDETKILKNTITYTDEITLKSNQSMFTLEVATSNFIPENKDGIYYKLEGFSDTWNRVRGQNEITYTNLNPGKYTLILRASNVRGILDEEKKIKINILPPIYNSPFAYLLYIIAITIILYYALKAYNAHVRLQESLKYEKKHLQDVEELNQSKLRFFTNISHEFRTPLTLIVGQIESLLQIHSYTPMVYNKILSIYKNSMQLKELITELLDFRKQELGHIKIKVSRNNIVDFLYENYLLFLEYASLKNIRLIFHKETDYLEVWYDTRQMQKVINNLISNALKHTNGNGTITISVRQHLKGAIIEISDTGIGIDHKHIDNIFQSFYQIQDTDTVTSTGTGIGLAIAKGIVELHHGEITLNSEPGKGSTFTIYLPLGNAHFSDEQISTQTEIIDKEPKTGDIRELPMAESAWEEETLTEKIPDAKILIVEDNDTIREMLVEIFKPFYQVTTASDGQEALGKIHKEMPSIILSDILMPRMSGTELCKQVKRNSETCHIPVVLLTARTAIEHNIEGLQIGADDYITKPFNTNLLISRCNNLVNSRLMLQEKFSNQPHTKVQMLATNPMDKEFLDNAMKVLEKYMDNIEFSVNTFAQEMGMARTYFFNKIKAITGQTPNEFITTVRLKKAAYMLRNNPELNVSAIADKVGFSSSRYFSKCFREVYHINPLSYRKGKDEDDPDNEKKPETEK